MFFLCEVSLYEKQLFSCAFRGKKDPDSTSPRMRVARKCAFHHYSDQFVLREYYYNSFLLKVLQHQHNEVINYMPKLSFFGREKDDFHLILPQ